MQSPTVITQSVALIRPHYQLRQVLLQSRTRPPAKFLPQCRAVSASPARLDAFDETTAPRARASHTWKRVRQQQQVVGKPGKRQRIASERLTINSLTEPSNIIVFSDVREASDNTIPHRARLGVSRGTPVKHGLSAEDVKRIENAVLGRELVPEEAEVNASIDAHRPDHVIVDDVELDRHRKALSDGYTKEQLSTYLTLSLQKLDKASASALIGKAGTLETTGWRPGSSPLKRRHAAIVRKRSVNTKAKIIEKILRVAWRLTTETEHQAVGELEVKLEPWQMEMLFDLAHQGRPYYESLIATRLLLESSQVEVWRPDNILRITARRQNAEEVFHQLRASLMTVEPLELQLHPYSLLLSQGVRQAPSELIKDEDVHYVSQSTQCVMVRGEEDTMTIYGTSPQRSHSARQMLLSMLQIPPPTSFDGTIDMAKDGLQLGHSPRTFQCPVDPFSLRVHRRYHSLDLFRDTEIRNAQRDDEQSPSVKAGLQTSHALEQAGKSLSEKIGSLPHPTHLESITADPVESYFNRPLRVGDRKAEFCRLLQPPRTKVDKKVESKTSSMIVQCQVSDAEALLTHFRTHDVPRPSNQLLTLISHFVPSPAAAASNPYLPRIEMRFHISASRPSDQRRKVRMVGLKAILDVQHLNVAVPQCSTDLRFSRDVSISSDAATAMQDSELHMFCAKLQDSAKHGHSALVAPPSIVFKLPQRVLNIKTAPGVPVQGISNVEYLFERFERVQTLHFRPRTETSMQPALQPDLRSVLEAFPEDHYLEYAEVESNAIYGNQSTLTLRAPTTPRLEGYVVESETHVDRAVSDGDGNGSPALQLCTAALQMAHFLTRANTGTAHVHPAAR